MCQRTRIKICGMTTATDALLAAELGADALGFIFYANSPRYITHADARAIINVLPPFVTPVAVTVNLPVEEIQRVMVESGCRAVQIHGDITDHALSTLTYPTIKACSIAGSDDLAPLANYPSACAFLLDTKKHGQHGGTGETFDWALARQARDFGHPIILAGGLTPENIIEAIHAASPYAVDVNSGIEHSPGHKDPERMRTLFHTIRACNEQLP